MVKAIFFDLDNTLVDRTQAAYRMFCDIVADCLPQYPKSSIEYENAVQSLMIWDEYGTIEKSHVFGRFCKKYDLNENLVAELSDRWMNEFGNYAIPFEKSEETLKELSKKYRLGLLTNGHSKMQRRKLEKSGFEKYFETIIVSGEQGIHKPDVRIFQMACDSIGLKPEEIAFVGDTFTTDILGACQCGMKPVWIHSDSLFRTDFELLRIHCIEELSELF